MQRRGFLGGLAALYGAGAFGLCLPLGATPAHAGRDHANDWRWLQGNWNVRHRRLQERLVADTRWVDFTGTSAVWLTLGGLGTIDDNLMQLPGGAYRGLGVRAFDPASATWAIWWLDGRAPSRFEAPVRGGFSGTGGSFRGADSFKGQPVQVWFRWHDIHAAQPWWEQAFSADNGVHWEVNWRNWFTRTAAIPSPLPLQSDAPRDFDFLVGRWSVQHQRLRERLSGSNRWDHFDGTLHNWPVLGGFGNVGDNVMNFPAATVRGMGIRAWDASSGQWSSWWLDGRDPTRIGAPVRGGFVDGVGTFMGDDQLRGQPIRTRVIWSRITSRSARWEQAASADGGATWETNWISDFERQA
ncbi:hypothetical protein WH218_06270 [Stenotrophomonas indicatrix]|uniref:hypothetical protein n=1 Tax=Stenotrophomonas indicatrix TaxID=2045451 RepID=UPI0015E0205F|nr:hypothetical protein [Stenotrophomonas indicatrix]MBA0098663.1 hypothetical protein [Stenotrophomonas indicatrix]